MLNKTLIATIIMLFVSSLSFGAVDCDGTDDFIDFGTGVTGSSTKIMGSAWVNINSAPASGNRYVIYELSTGVGAHNFTFEYRNDSGTYRLLTSWYDGADYHDWHTTSETDLGTSTWYHVAMEIDTSQNPDVVTFYVDGTSYSTTNAFGTNNANMDTGTKSLYGCKAVDSGRIGNLIVNEIALWSGVNFTGSEVALLSSSKAKRIPLQIQPSSLQVYAPLDDEPDGTSADGDTFLDMSGSGNNGTGDDGANNTGLTANAEEVLTY